MKTQRSFTFLMTGFLGLALSTTAFAQDALSGANPTAAQETESDPLVPEPEDASLGPAAAPSEPVSVAPPVAAPPVEQAQPRSELPICLLGTGKGDPNAETSASLICESLREHGVKVVTVQEEIPAPSVYRVHLRPLGSLFYLELVHEQPAGQVVASRRLQISGIEQVPTASQRLVEALVSDIPIERTARSNTLVSQETRPTDVRKTHTRFSMGITGVMVGGDLGYGADIAFGFVGHEYGSQLRGRLAGGDAKHVSLGVSGWRYLGQGEISPFVGAGVGIAYLGDGDNFSNGGLIVGPTVGIEAFRFDSSRLQVALQLDIPLFRLEKQHFNGLEDVEERRYTLGGGLNVSYIF